MPFPGHLDGLDRTELLMAIEERCPGLTFPESTTRSDLLDFLRGLYPPDPNDDPPGLGVRRPRPRPVNSSAAEAALDD